MRLLSVGLLAVIVVVAVPLTADTKPGIGGMDDGRGCVGCDYIEDLGETSCEWDERQDWMDCESGITRQCDGWGQCVYVPSCGDRCAYA